MKKEEKKVNGFVRMQMAVDYRWILIGRAEGSESGEGTSDAFLPVVSLSLQGVFKVLRARPPSF